MRWRSTAAERNVAPPRVFGVERENVRSLFTEGLFAIMTARTSHLEDVPLRTMQLRKQHFYRAPTHSCTMIGFYENG
jgi:hypothetical protein